jgi:hypothetical protein
MPDPMIPLKSLNGHPIRDAVLWQVVSPGYSEGTAYPLNSHVVVGDILYRNVHPIDNEGEPWNAEHWIATTVDEELSRGIQQGIDALHVLAQEYNPTHSYLVGNYVMKNGIFYRCNTEITTGEDWDSSHWDEVTVSAELSSQRVSLEALRDIVTSEYDPEQAYPKNSYVIKDGTLYRSLVDIPGLDPWNLNKWESCTVGLELGNSRTMDKFTQDSIAPEYNSSRTYQAGELVMHNGKLYRCLTTVAVPEPWNSARWGLTSIANEVSMSDITSVFGFYIDDEGYLSQNITSDGMDPSTVNLDEVLGFYISVDGYISQKTSA